MPRRKRSRLTIGIDLLTMREIQETAFRLRRHSSTEGCKISLYLENRRKRRSSKALGPGRARGL